MFISWSIYRIQCPHNNSGCAMNLYSSTHRSGVARESPAETKGQAYTLLHQHWLHTSLNGACYHLLQHHSDQPMVLWYNHSAFFIHIVCLTVHQRRISRDRFAGSGRPLASAVSQTCWMFSIVHIQVAPTIKMLIHVCWQCKQCSPTIIWSLYT